MAKRLETKRGRIGATIAAAVVAGGLIVAASLPTPPAKPAAAPRAAAAATKPVATPAAVAKPATPPAPAADAYVVKRILDVPNPMRHGQWFWDEEGAPKAGPMIITVDLEAQVLSVFRDGYEIGTSVILYGADAKPTPLGVFAISQKDADHVSNIYGAPMPYMLRLTNDGISIHGSDVQAGYMTHGCVGVPTAFAKRLFGQVKRGDRVIVTNGEVLQLGGAITAA